MLLFLITLIKTQSDQKKLYDQLAPYLFGVCRRYTKSKYDAEDYLQEAFIKIFTKIDTFKNEVPIHAWAKRILINTILEDIRKNKNINQTMEIDEIVQEFATLDDGQSQLEHEELLNMINCLPNGKKLIFNLYVIEGYNHKEIAEQLGISEGTSKSQLAKAKELLSTLHKTYNLKNEQTFS